MKSMGLSPHEPSSPNEHDGTMLCKLLGHIAWPSHAICMLPFCCLSFSTQITTLSPTPFPKPNKRLWQVPGRRDLMLSSSPYGQRSLVEACNTMNVLLTAKFKWISNSLHGIAVTFASSVQDTAYQCWLCLETRCHASFYSIMHIFCSNVRHNSTIRMYSWELNRLSWCSWDWHNLYIWVAHNDGIDMVNINIDQYL